MITDTVTTTTDGDVTILAFVRPERGMADPDQVRRFFHRDFQGRVSKVQRLVIDLAGVGSLDSGALGPLVQKLRDLQLTKGRMALCGVDAPALREVLSLTRFDKVFAIHSSRAAAVAAVSA
jgi:anti-sigma B factor antagonist